MYTTQWGHCGGNRLVRNCALVILTLRLSLIWEKGQGVVKGQPGVTPRYFCLAGALYMHCICTVNSICNVYALHCIVYRGQRVHVFVINTIHWKLTAYVENLSWSVAYIYWSQAGTWMWSTRKWNMLVCSIHLMSLVSVWIVHVTCISMNSTCH